MRALSLFGLLLSSMAMAGEVELTIDSSRPGAVIAPYLYGQFIEHLGRSIYGGIWAEMLRDRKFFLPVGAPWEIVKPEGADVSVSPDAAGSFAGRYSLALWVRAAKNGRCGIRQGSLGLVAGKEYVGTLVAAHAQAPVPVEVRLAWGAGADAGQSVLLKDIGTDFGRTTFRFRAVHSTDSASLSLTLAEPGLLRVACVSLMPADHVNGMRPDTLALVRKLAPPIIRWPGGNFVSGYHWKDGIGDRDRRPPRWDRAWNEVEPNDFGIDEFLAFCAAVAAEPYLAVNSGLGTPEEAADWVEYVNGPAESRWGAERGRHGHPQPYRVTWWGVGNEMYGDWQLGHLPVAQYARRHNTFVKAMKERDPSLRIVASGTPGRWNDALLPDCAGNMDLLSGHHYTHRQFYLPLTAAAAQQYEENFITYSAKVAQGIHGLIQDLRQRQGAGNPAIDRVRLAVDEWGVVRDWRFAPDGPGLDVFEHYYCLGDALTAARGLHELVRNCDLVAMANWAQTVNVIGAIKTNRTAAVLDPVGHVLALYRAHLKGVLLPIDLSTGSSVDAVAGWDAQSGNLALALINFSPRQEAAVKLRLTGGLTLAEAHGERLDGPALAATNVPGQAEAVTTTPLPGPIALDRPLVLPPHSITLLEAKGTLPKQQP